MEKLWTNEQDARHSRLVAYTLLNHDQVGVT